MAGLRHNSAGGGCHPHQAVDARLADGKANPPERRAAHGGGISPASRTIARSACRKPKRA